MVSINYITNINDIFINFIKNVPEKHLYYSTNNIVQNIPQYVKKANKKTIGKANNLLNLYMNPKLCYNNEVNVWNICLTQNNFMFNLPFTLKDVIFIPLSYNIKYLNTEHLLTTFIHEKIHIYQRYNSNNWNDVIQRTTKWRRMNIDIGGIVNPDTYYMPYSYNNKYYAYITDNNGLKIHWADIRTKKSVNINSKYDHPYELTAYKLSEEIVKMHKN